MPILLHTSGPAMGRKKYVQRRISTSTVLARNLVYPNATDDAPIIGADPDLEYLAMNQDVKPDYDPRVWSLLTNEDRAAGAPELEDGRPTWHITFDTVKRAADEIKANATNVEAVKNRLHMTEQERDKLVILALHVLFRQVNNQQLTAREINLKQRVLAMGAAFWKNDQRLKDIFTALEANQEPDLDDQWEPAP